MRLSIGFLKILLLLSLYGVGRAEEAIDWKGHTFHRAPKELPSDAKTHDWPRFLGPTDDGISTETGIADSWSEKGPEIVWEASKGNGYAAPSIADGRLFLFHRVGDEERLDCLDPETGKRFWSQNDPVEYTDRYGFNNGPRAGPVIDGDRVYTYGVTSRMICRNVETGEKIWERDFQKDYKVPQYFFGSGPCPLVWKDLLIQNVGGKEQGGGLCVGGFNKLTGELIWRVDDTWGASYASPIMATLHGKPRVLVLAGGESRPPHGGLLCIDPTTGEVEARFPWRADKFESVNAASPVVVNSHQVFITECYEKGGVLLVFDDQMNVKPVWTARDLGMHWHNPILKEGYLYGFQGRNEPDAFLTCYEVATGKEMWRDELTWKITKKARRGENTYGWGYFRGALLSVEDRFLCLGEMGTLAWLDLTPNGVKELQKVDLFQARSTWTPPALSRGLLYICQNERDFFGDSLPRILCYDLRDEGKE